MALSRLRAGELIALVSGVALVALLFAEWFDFNFLETPPAQRLADAEGVTPGLSGWEAFDFLDVYLLLVALAGIALAVVTGLRPLLPSSIAAAVIASALAIVGTVLVVWRVLVNQPQDDALLDTTLAGYLGVLAVIGVAVGAWRSMADERTDTPEARAQARALADLAGPPRPVP